MAMLKSIKGVYKDGKVELSETPTDLEGSPVIVTFLPRQSSQPNGPPLSSEEIAELRWRLESWQEDWNAPGMEDYDAL